MPGKNRKKGDYATIQRRMRIAKMYCEGKIQEEIAHEEGISLTAVHKHLRKIREFWLSNILLDFDQKQAELLAKNDLLETRAWEGYEKSCKDAETIKETTEEGIRVEPSKEKGKPPKAKLVPIKKATEKITKGQAGDPRFLSIIGDCIDRRAKILGITDEKPVSNVFLNFDSLLQEVGPKSVDGIENKIQEVIDHKPSQQGGQNIPNGFKEIPPSPPPSSSNGEHQ